MPFWYTFDMNEVLTYLERLREIALDQHGFVTSAQAVESGIPKVELPKLASRGRIERVSRGIYRVPQVASSGHENLALAVLWTGADEACLSHETALAAWAVSDINPDAIHVTIGRARRLRRTGGERYVIHLQDLQPSQQTWWQGIAITTLPTTIADCIEAGVATYLVRQALDRGDRAGLLTQADSARLGAILTQRDALGAKA